MGEALVGSLGRAIMGTALPLNMMESVMGEQRTDEVSL